MIDTVASKNAAKVELRGLSQVFYGERDVVALESVSLSIPAGRFVSLIGPSGCGKSTIFNILAGLQLPTKGAVFIDGENVTGSIGTVGYMLQKDLLLPWRTVLDNIILGMEIRGMPVKQARERALPYLYKYGLGNFEKQYPAALSGGMRQRAALLRTLLYDCEIILLDEPFGALDAQTRVRMQEWLLQIWADFGKTIIFVTHDVDEAVYLSDEIYVMSPRPGRVKDRFDVDLSRPRPRSLINTPQFAAYRQQCLDLLSHDAPEEEAASAA